MDGLHPVLSKVSRWHSFWHCHLLYEFRKEKAMHIGIITYHRALNYGSVLQAYALNKFLRNQGYQVETIDYWNEGQEKIYKRFEACNSLMALARNMQTLLYLKKVKKKEDRFSTYIKRYIPTTEQVEHNKNVLNQIAYSFDCVICGSDQIWNPYLYGVDPIWTLKFAPAGSKKIAYAPSLGISSIPNEFIIKFQENLKLNQKTTN